MKEEYDVIVIGAGLAGLTVSYKLAKDNYKVLLIEKEKFLGGRTSSWNDQGFEVESGFHRHIGYYRQLPKLLKEVGINLNDIIMWEKETEIIITKNKKIVLGISPFHNPVTFIKDILGNNEILTFKDKISLLKLFIIGFFDYTFKRKKLDSYSILNYCHKLNIRENVIEYIVTPLSTGIFFLPKEKYSSLLFFGLFYQSLFHPISLRIGAYKGGMSEILAKPIIDKFISYGGKIKTNTKVSSLIEKDNRIIGVKTNKEIYSKHVVLATDINNAKKIISTIKNKEKNQILKIPTTSAMTIHLELTKPSMPQDRTTFAPYSITTSFTEESRSTFKKSKGRLSIIIANPDEYINLPDKEIYLKTIKDLKLLGIDLKSNVIDYRVIRHKNKFYNFSYNNDHYRPNSDIGIKGLFLAGDYIKQKMYSTMEGAVISGLKAYQKIIKK